MVIQYPINILRQELMAEMNGFYHFNGVKWQISSFLMVCASSKQRIY